MAPFTLTINLSYMHRLFTYGALLYHSAKMWWPSYRSFFLLSPFRLIFVFLSLHYCLGLKYCIQGTQNQALFCATDRVMCKKNMVTK